MAHPEMFDPNDPLLARIRQIALELPEAAEKISHGRPTFFTKKVFAIYGAAVRHGEGDWVQHPQSILVRLEPDERAAMLEEPAAFVPAYWGPSGWIGIDLTAESDLAEIAELIESSYRVTAPARLVRLLDES